MRGDIGASTVEAKDMKCKLKYVQHVYGNQSDFLKKTSNKIIDSSHPLGRKVLGYLEVLNISTVSDLTEMSEGDLYRRIDDLIHREWIVKLNERSTLRLYRERKNEIKEEIFYGNSFHSVLLFKARSNSLKLGWRERFEGVHVNCKLCGAHEETLVQCHTLRYMRDEYEITGVTIQNILGFGKDGDIEKYKTYLDKIW